MPNDTWEDFKSWALTVPKQGRESWIFRGHSDATWHLQSTLFRNNPRNVSLHDYRWFVISEIEYHYCTLYGEVLNLQNGLQMAYFLSQLRHHGFPTPLLDWSMSPFVAAYFALRNLQEGGVKHTHARVFAFDYLAWQRDFSPPSNVWDMFINPGLPEFITILKPIPKNNTRIIPQQGRFMISNSPDLSKHIDGSEKLSGKKYLYWQDITVADADRALTDLDLMGIREMTLFPDFEGLCRNIERAVFSSPHVTVPPSLAHIFERVTTIP
jgi:hypothetical protein